MKLTICNDILCKVPSFDVIPYVMDVDNLNTDKVTELIDQLSKKYYNLYRFIYNFLLLYDMDNLFYQYLINYGFEICFINIQNLQNLNIQNYHK